MTAAQDLAGTVPDFLDPATYDEGVPYGLLAELRAGDRMVRVAESEGPGYVVALGHDEIVQISKNPATFSSWAMSSFPKDPRASELGEVRQMLLNMDPPEHTRHRLIVNRVFTPRMVRQLQSGIESHARDVVAALPDEGEFDFVRHVGVEMSLRVLADVMGLSQGDRHLLYDWTERLVGDGDTELGGDPKEFISAITEMFAYADEHTERKRREPADDVWSLVANAEMDGERLQKEELNRFFQLLATAGNETTRTLISGGFLALAEFPDQHRLLLEDLDGRCDLAVEEMLRFAPPIMQFRRTAMADAVVGATSISEGDKVLLFYPAANRDPAVFSDPDDFDIRRDPNPHLSFGIGPHFCLGANLARVQARALFRELLGQPYSLRLTGAVTRVRSSLINGFKGIPVERT